MLWQMAEDLIELGLVQPGSETSDWAYRALLDRIMAILPQATIESERLRSGEFIEQVHNCRRHLRKSDGPQAVADFPVRCEDYFKRARAYRLERDNEYVELVDVLRQTFVRLAGESLTFHSQLVNTSTRLNRFAEIDDIRLIKHRITSEAADLQRLTEEKRRQDENNLSKLTRRIELLESSLSHAKAQASTDPLTKIPNRGDFDSRLALWITEFEESGQPFVLGMADIDNFKVINDTHGHPVGDRVLLCASQWISSSVRDTDFVARYGGEEFAILLSRINLTQAEARIEGLLKRLAEHRFEYQAESETRTLGFTLSVGLVEVAPGDTVETLIRRADESLYEAKRKGKNRVIARKRSKLKSLFG